MKKLTIILAILLQAFSLYAIDISQLDDTGVSETQNDQFQPQYNTRLPRMQMIPDSNNYMPNNAYHRANYNASANPNRGEKNTHYELEECVAYGCFLFGGDFSRERLPVFNPEYSVAVGDQINIKLWGGANLDIVQTVDAQGNIFIPTVGPVAVLGVSNNKLTEIIKSRINKVYTSNVGIYAGLLEAQPIMVYVGGNVVKPGAYAGTSSNSLMYFLDLARGIDQRAGSFLDIKLLRNNKPVKVFNLYDFILKGKTPETQFMDGDMIYVESKSSSVKVQGLIVNKYEFEFDSETINAADLMKLAKPLPEATHIRITRNSLHTKDVEYYSFDQLNNIIINNGDDVEVLSDKMDGTITVRIEGEHIGEKEIAFPYGTRLSDVLEKIDFSPIADKKAITLYRKSVATKQKEQLLQSLNKIEMSVLKASSDTVEEAKLRLDESQLIMKWVEKAKQVETKGQILLSNTSYFGVILENGDRLVIPNDNALVHIYGEVLFPLTITYEEGTDVEDLIAKAGGLSNEDAKNRIIVKARSGMVSRAEMDTHVNKGDEIMVLPEVDVKSFQLAKDISLIVYQIAVSAGVLLAL